MVKSGGLFNDNNLSNGLKMLKEDKRNKKLIENQNTTIIDSITEKTKSRYNEIKELFNENLSDIDLAKDFKECFRKGLFNIYTEDYKYTSFAKSINCITFIKQKNSSILNIDFDENCFNNFIEKIRKIIDYLNKSNDTKFKFKENQEKKGWLGTTKTIIDCNTKITSENFVEQINDLYEKIPKNTQEQQQLNNESTADDDTLPTNDNTLETPTETTPQQGGKKSKKSKKAKKTSKKRNNKKKTMKKGW